MQLAGLSFDHMPKFSTPLRFFISAPIFGLLACLVMLMPSIWLSRWQMELLALTHLFTLGFFVMIMFGAMTQILPVLTGRGLPHVDTLAPRIHLFLILGALLFPLNFIMQDSFLLILSVSPLLIAILVMCLSLAYLFKRKQVENISIQALRFALLALVFCVVTGLIKVLHLYFPALIGAGSKALTNLHLMWGLIGWVHGLIMAISFQVIPMFHVTPDFPNRLKRYGPVTLFAVLVSISLGVFAKSPFITNMGLVMLAGGGLYYGYCALQLLSRRQRKVRDVTVNFWRLALMNLVLAIMLFAMSWLVPIYYQHSLQMLSLLWFVFGYLMAVVMGMLLKITPFLAYLNLQQSALNCIQAMMVLPSMHEIQGKKLTFRIFQTYLFSLPCLLLIPWLPMASYGLAAVFAGVFGQLIYFQFSVWFNYQKHDDAIQTIMLENSVTKPNV